MMSANPELMPTSHDPNELLDLAVVLGAVHD
jgi:hypothetical protein